MIVIWFCLRKFIRVLDFKSSFSFGGFFGFFIITDRDFFKPVVPHIFIVLILKDLCNVLSIFTFEGRQLGPPRGFMR